MPSAPGSRIHFFFKRAVGLTHRKGLKSFIERFFAKESIRLQNLNIIFCSDRDLLRINQEYLGHNDYTDIITFNYGDKRGVEGEIFISVDRVRENARQFGNTLNAELHRVIFHGLLHLSGSRDKTLAQKKSMRALEDKLLAAYFRLSTK
jgi:probable rRNA maturation factor